MLVINFQSRMRQNPQISCKVRTIIIASNRNAKWFSATELFLSDGENSSFSVLFLRFSTCSFDDNKQPTDDIRAEQHTDLLFSIRIVSMSSRSFSSLSLENRHQSSEQFDSDRVAPTDRGINFNHATTSALPISSNIHR